MQHKNGCNLHFEKETAIFPMRRLCLFNAAENLSTYKKHSKFSNLPVRRRGRVFESLTPSVLELKPKDNLQEVLTEDIALDNRALIQSLYFA